MALTATATERVQKDIIRFLQVRRVWFLSGPRHVLCCGIRHGINLITCCRFRLATCSNKRSIAPTCDTLCMPSQRTALNKLRRKSGDVDCSYVSNMPALDVYSLDSVLCSQRQELAKCMRYCVLLLQEGLRRHGRDVEEDVSAVHGNIFAGFFLSTKHTSQIRFGRESLSCRAGFCDKEPGCSWHVSLACSRVICTRRFNASGCWIKLKLFARQ